MAARTLTALCVAVPICLSTTGCIPLLVGGLVGYELAKDRREDKDIASANKQTICERPGADGRTVCTEVVVRQAATVATVPPAQPTPPPPQ